MSTLVVNNMTDSDDYEFDFHAHVVSCWFLYNQSTPAVTDSHNITSIADLSLARFNVSYANSFSASDQYQRVGCSASDNTAAGSGVTYNLGQPTDRSFSAGSRDITSSYSSAGSSAYIDSHDNNAGFVGELA